MSVGIASLSQEIIILVASYLQRWEHKDRADISSERGQALLPAYASVSQSWQYAIECQTFREIAVKSTEIDTFSQNVVNHRRKQLRRLKLNVILPTYTDQACAKFETEKDKQSNNQVFTKAIKDVLALLRSWHDESQTTKNDSDAPIEPLLRLSIGDCYSPKDCQYRGWEKYQEDCHEWEYRRRHDLFQHRYESSLLQLESLEGIQKIPQISSFYKTPSNRNIEPRSLAMIASKFPNLDSFLWMLQDNEKRNPPLRQQTRLDFAEALPMIPRGSLKRVALDLYHNPLNNQDFNPLSSLMPSYPTTDHLSLAIHALSQSENLTHLDLGDYIVISPSLFWPEPQTKQPFWPNLVWVKVIFSMNTADGDWYFTRDYNADVESEDDDDDAESDTASFDGSEADDTTTKQNPDPDIPDIYNEKKVALAIGEEPYREFRNRADPGKLNPLFEAAAQAAAQMPRLQRMTLKTEVRAYRRFTFAMTYFAPSEQTDWGAGSRNVGMPRLDWVIGRSGYEPEKSILKIWRQAKGDIMQTVAERGHT